MRNTAFTLVLLLTLLCVRIHAEAGGSRAGHPIHITSNELLTDSKSGIATFQGKVQAKQKDVTIFADKLVVRYSGQGGDVDTVEAFGNVRVVQLNRLATAGRAIYSNRDGKITLSVAPKVYQGKDVVSGTVITYLLDEDKSVVTGGPDGRVDVMIYPKGKGKDDDGAR